MPPWRRLALLSAGEWGLLSLAYINLLLAEIALHLRPFSELTAIDRWCAEQKKVQPDDAQLNPASLENTAQFVALADRHAPWEASCLRQSFALAWMLARRGISTSIKIGVANTPGQVQAHAWLETTSGPLTRFFYAPEFTDLRACRS